MKKLNLVLFFIICLNNIYSQQLVTPETISKNISNYFTLERESIYVQFNKSCYITNEQIAFKGYIFHRNSRIPNLSTSNIQLVVYNELGEAVLTKLLLAQFGSFENTITLDRQLASGVYYFQFYTNYMNNFREDESFQHKVEIINASENYNLNTTQLDFSNVSIKLNPESGNLINDVINTVGISVKDNLGKPVHTTNGLVLDSKGRLLTHFYTNRLGYGKFDFKPKLNETYSVKIELINQVFTLQIPASNNTGLTMSTNNNLPDAEISVSIKTNSSSLKLIKDNNFFLVIQQDDKSIITPFNFNNNNSEQILNFDKINLFDGVNSFRVIDQSNNQIAERLVYVEKVRKQSLSLIANKVDNDSIILHGSLKNRSANLSISILDSRSICKDAQNSIIGTIKLNTYLSKYEENTAMYFDQSINTRYFDLDLLLINQSNSKYNWNDLMYHSPKELFRFDKGISISGHITKTVKQEEDNKLMIFSTSENLFEDTKINILGEFKFDNLILYNNSTYQAEFLQKNIPVETKITVIQSPSGFRLYKKPVFPPVLTKQTKDSTFTMKFDHYLPDEKNIELNEIKIQNNTSKKLAHLNDFGNRSARHFKIDQNYGTLKTFIESKGYQLLRDKNYRIQVYSRRDQNIPIVVNIDGFLIFDFSRLDNINMINVDEIYIGKNSLFTSGFINIYMKRDYKFSIEKNLHSPFVIKNGFEIVVPFKNPNYSPSKLSALFGTLNWLPTLRIGEENSFKVPFKNDNQKEITVLIEGYGSDGQLISETQTIPILP